jgi:hypothetical protein
VSTHDQIWDDDGEAISYLKEMVTHPTSIYSLLGTLTLAALVSIPLGVGLAAIPVLMYAAVQAIAALFIPSSPVFQEMINRKKRIERREKMRRHLVSEIERREDDGQFHWRAYHRMRERVESLNEFAEARNAALSPRDVERLDDATVDYLGLWLGWLVMAERWQNTDEEGLRRRVEAIDRQLEKVSGVEAKRLEKAREDLERILKRRESLWGRATEIEAKMLAMSDTLEEVYQRVMLNPHSGDAAGQLQEAVERMKVEEEIDYAVDAELENLLGSSKKRKARAAQARSV